MFSWCSTGPLWPVHDDLNSKLCLSHNANVYPDMGIVFDLIATFSLTMHHFNKVKSSQSGFQNMTISVNGF